jgi:NitT/TauT family transport system permease protein
LVAAAIVFACLVLWEFAVRLDWVSSLFFPPPTFILKTLARMAWTGPLWPSLGITLARLGAGLTIGAGAGLMLGWLMGASRPVRVVLDPVVAALHPMPKLALFPIFLVLLGIGEASKIVLVALAAFFPMLINTLAGVRQIDGTCWEVAVNYGAKRMTLLRRVILPGSLPMAMVGLRLAANNALVVTIAVEMLSAQEGLGATIWMAWQTLRTEELFATLIVIGVVGIVMHRLVERLTHWLTPWQTREKQHV